MIKSRLMIPGVGQAGREQARCEDRPSCEGWQQPRWSSSRRTRTTGSWLPRGSHILVQNCGWVGVKSSKLCNENTNSMYMAYLAILGILFFMIYKKTVNFLKTIMTTFPYLHLLSGSQVVSEWSPSGSQVVYLSVSYLISSKRLLFENIAQDGSFQHCTWLYLALTACTWLYLALPRSAMIYLTIDWHWFKCFPLKNHYFKGFCRFSCF